MALILTGCALQRDIATVAPNAAVGTRAPALSGQALDGSSMRVAFTGTRTVVVFWAAWCGPCRKEQPTLNRIAADYAAQGISLVGVDMLDHDRALAKAFVQEFSVPYQSLYDDAGRAAAVYEVDGPPAIVLVDAQGVIVGRLPGEVPDSVLRQLIVTKLQVAA
jgi:cytochrome c biogenesis protein CcmG, thiol:disulfide interchange protein DsbE